MRQAEKKTANQDSTQSEAQVGNAIRRAVGAKARVGLFFVDDLFPLAIQNNFFRPPQRRRTDHPE